MGWKVEFYSIKVKDAIRAWPESLSAKFLKIAERIEQYGPLVIGMPHIKPLKKGFLRLE